MVFFELGNGALLGPIYGLRSGHSDRWNFCFIVLHGPLKVHIINELIHLLPHLLLLELCLLVCVPIARPNIAKIIHFDSRSDIEARLIQLLLHLLDCLMFFIHLKIGKIRLFPRTSAHTFLIVSVKGYKLLLICIPGVYMVGRRSIVTL